MILLVFNTSRSWFSHDNNVNGDVGELKSPCKINVDREDQPTNKLMQMIKDKQQYVNKQINSIFTNTKLSDFDDDYR